MRWHDLLARALPRLRGNRMERELDEELRFHVELRTEENMRRGMAPEEARLAALRAFGGLEQAREDCRNARPGSRIEMFGRDLRYGVRALRRNPVFTCAAVITLALGIGALMSVFSLFDAALLQPLPYEGANRLLALNYSGTPYSVYPGGQIHVSAPGTWHLPYSQFQALKEQSHVLAGAGLYHTPQIAEARTGEISEQCLWASVTAGVFEALTTRPIRGRVFTAQEDRPGAPGTAVISAAFWRRRFNGREDVLGRQIVIQGNSYTIVGILPSSYRFPAGRTPDSNVEVWTPLRVDLGRSVQNWLFQMAATLKPGVTLAQAQEELRAIVARLNRENASSQRTPPTAPPTVTWYRDQVVGDYSSAFLILLAAGIFVMGIACANVANLFIIRAEKSRREQALRVVLGAGRGRLVAQNLAEALLVAAAGSSLGILLAWWSLDVMRSLAREMIPRLNEAAIGMEGLGLAVGVALAALAVMAVAPAMRVSGLSLQRELGASPMVAGQRGNRVRGVLVVVEFALALTLVFGAGLMIRSLQNLMGIGLGFNPDRVLTFTFTFPRGWYVPGRDEEFCDLLMRRLAATPGVTAAGLTSYFPLADWIPLNVIRSERVPAQPSQLTVRYAATPGYFKAMGIPVLKGRGFVESDRSRKDQVVIIDQSLAERFWPGGDAVGKRLFVDGTRIGSPGGESLTPAQVIPLEVVGVVPSVRKYSFRKSPLRSDREEVGEYYRPVGAFDGATNLWARSVAVRTQGDPAGLMDTIRREVNALDGQVVLSQFTTMRDRWLDFSAETRFYTAVLNIFGVCALFLAAVGIYGVTAFAMSQRTHEFGIRMALGAPAKEIFRLAAAEGSLWVLAGAGGGVLGALVLGRYLGSILYEVSGRSLATLLAAAIVMAGAAVLACYLPARRATKLDPWTILRVE